MSQHRVSVPAEGNPQTIVINLPRRGGWFAWVLLGLLGMSAALNLLFLIIVLAGFSISDEPSPVQTYHSGEESAARKIAIIRIEGTIMPPFTERIIDTIDYVKEDSDVRGVLVVVDSPGGLVADSHQIYHRLQQLKDTKPVYVAMTRMAASGGYYVAMGAGPQGKIYAEPTTWTGSIGVIIPRYDLSELATEYGVRSEPLTTGPYKDSLNPFRELSDDEREVWSGILDDAFGKFQEVIVDNRNNLDADDVAELATGRIFTADQALENGLVDQIGYVEDALKDLEQKIGRGPLQAVEYEYPISFTEALFGSAEARQQSDPLQQFFNAGVPRAMYFCGWSAGMGE
jgi:protease-4